MNDSDPIQNPENWGRYSEVYDTHFAAFTALYARDAVRVAGVRPGQRVLDVAAGTGAASLAAAKEGAQVLATDFSPGMVERLRANAEQQGLAAVRAEVMDGQALTVDEHAFDAAISIFGLMFFPDRAAGFQGLLRALKPGGRAVVACWSTLERMRFQQVIRDALYEAVPDFPEPDPPPPWQELSDKARLRSEMLAAGFARVNLFSVTHLLTFEQPEVLWDGLAGSSPPMAMMMKGLSPEQIAAFRAAFIGSIHNEQGDGPFGLEAEAHLAVGVR